MSSEDKEILLSSDEENENESSSDEESSDEDEDLNFDDNSDNEEEEIVDDCVNDDDESIDDIGFDNDLSKKKSSKKTIRKIFPFFKQKVDAGLCIRPPKFKNMDIDSLKKKIHTFIKPPVNLDNMSHEQCVEYARHLISNPGD